MGARLVERRWNSAGCHGEPVDNTLSHLAATHTNPFSALHLLVEENRKGNYGSVCV